MMSDAGLRWEDGVYGGKKHRNNIIVIIIIIIIIITTNQLRTVKNNG